MDNCKKNYRIVVTPISEEAQDLPDDLRCGIECKGFTLIADLGDRCLCAFQNVSTFDIAQAMSKESNLMQAAHIAKAMREAAQMKQSDRFSDFIGALAKGGSMK